MSSYDRNVPMSFDFFKKRKKRDRNKSKTNGYTSPVMSVTSLSESFINSSQQSKSSSIKRGTFRGILNDSVTPKSQKRKHDTSETNESLDAPPNYPNIDTNLCKAFNYITWARDQMVFGNEHIISLPNLEQLFLTQLNKMRSDMDQNVSILKCITEVIYNRMLDIYNSYNYLLNNTSQYCHLSTVYLNSYIFVRPVDFSNFDFLTNTADVAISIEGHRVNKPTFIQEHLISYFGKSCEYLPSKYSSEYIYKQISIENDYLPNLITKVTLQRAMKQLVVVKAIVDIPIIDLLPYEGYEMNELKTGEKGWLPLYISERLTHSGFIVVELPSYLTQEFLRDFRKREHKSSELEKLPNDYFFEIAYIFTKAKLFKKLYIPNMSNRSKMYNYISKVAGIVEDIKYFRIAKIRSYLDTLSMSNSIIQFDNFQFSETYLINQFLSGYCPFVDKAKKLDHQPWMQIDHLIGDLENTLLDSIKQPIV
ncbi:conserved hypothetical protein [Theileria equi strain WA]|uniref:GINS subunit domain-containing protein n=1 Tax=Theileria equi strain WA TaxID=1537102 RepID=L1LCV9_THEEQ|nr:conserved hypothetical protein [Theileria equi strain WA]EKX73119.1 conserved hypothetical protein [Theileria equi strain WA]|eukprot:XP_004832571.1 conserved hypothetical protein [Theileria equi strain WA]